MSSNEGMIEYNHTWNTLELFKIPIHKEWIFHSEKCLSFHVQWLKKNKTQIVYPVKFPLCKKNNKLQNQCWKNILFFLKAFVQMVGL